MIAFFRNHWPRRTSFCAGALIVASALGMPRSSRGEDGTLEIYSRETQVGTIARRVVKDDAGRPVRETHYRAKQFGKRPVREEDLSAYEVHFYCYDGSGREIWMGVYSPGLILRRSQESLYDSAGRLTTLQWRESDGIVRYKTLRDGTRKVAALYFDDTGEKLIGIRGSMPPGIDLDAGWGTPVDGVSCGIGLNHAKGALREISFHVNVRNLSGESRKVAGDFPYRMLRLELRDRNRRLVPQDTARIGEKDRELARMNNGAKESMQTLEPGRAENFCRYYNLEDWYADLPDGTYYLTVKRRGDGRDFTLRSKAVMLEITGGSLPRR